MEPFVLVIDDDDANLALTEQQLAKLGTRSRSARGGTPIAGDVAFEASLVLLDCQMPVMDGFAVTRAIRLSEEGTRRRVPIVAMTADSTSANRKACLAAGMDDVVTKPISLEQLSAVLVRWLPESAALVKNVVGDESDETSAAAASAGPGEWLRAEMGDDDDAARIVHLYLDALDERIRRVEHSVETRDSEALTAAAHALKGPSSLVGAAEVAASCASLEKAGRERDWLGAAGVVRLLKNEADHSRETLGAAFP